MDADKAHYAHLVEVAALAHQSCLAANIACAMQSLYSIEPSISSSYVKQAAARASAANEDLVDWRERHPAGVRLAIVLFSAS